MTVTNEMIEAAAKELRLFVNHANPATGRRIAESMLRAALAEAPVLAAVVKLEERVARLEAGR